MANHELDVRGQDTRWFPSAVDVWIGAAIVVVPLVTLAALAVALVEDEGIGIALITCGAVALLYRVVLVPVRYGLASDHLVVQFGLIRRRVPYSEVRSVRPTRNPLSSPALSLNRLRVTYGEGAWQAVKISPAGRDAFLDELARRTGLRRTGDSLEP